MSWRETYWEGTEGNRISIEEILNLLLEDHIVDLDILELQHIKSLAEDPHRIREADLAYPIVVIENLDGYQTVLDGHHRLSKAR